MMKKLIANFLCFLLLLSSFPVTVTAADQTADEAPPQFIPSKHCPYGKCIGEFTELHKAKIIQANKDQCLPPANVSKTSDWYQNKPLSADCFRQIKEIEELEEKLNMVQLHLSGKTEKGTCLNCKSSAAPKEGLVENLKEIDKVNANLACTPERKKEIADKGMDDVKCVMVASALTVTGPTMANLLLPSSMKAKGCKAGQDSCLNQLAAGFIKAVFGLFEGLWDLLKMAGSGIAKGIKNLWDWVKGPEAKSSTSQLAAAKASEEEGFFRQLKNDFGGTMAKVWAGLMETIKEWLSSSIFCQEWSGKPQFSECKRPAQGLGCTDYKAMITGMCALSGTIISEVIPAFLTGGIFTAAKYGASAAAKLVKNIKVSPETVNKIKNSKIAQMAVTPVTKVTKSIQASRAATELSAAIKAALAALKTHMLSPLVKTAKAGIEGMKTAARTSKTYIMLTPAGPVFTFGLKAAKTAGKVIIFPIENALTIKSFQLGNKAIEKLVQKMGGGAVSNSTRPVLVVEAGRGMSVIDDAYKNYRLANVAGDPKAIEEAAKKYVSTAAANRAKVIEDYLNSPAKPKFQETIDELYPELAYGRYGKAVTPEQVSKAEEELFQAIAKIKDKKQRDAFFLDYQEHLVSLTRKNSTPANTSFTKQEVLRNAGLDGEAQINKVEEIIGDSISGTQRQKIAAAIDETKKVGSGAFSLTVDDVQQQRRILASAGVDQRLANNMVYSGITTRVRDQDTYETLRRVAVPKAEGLVEQMSKHPEYGKIILAQAEDVRPAMAKAIKVMENGGFSPADAANAFTTFEKQFLHVRKLGGPDSDAPALLGEFIRRQKTAGLSDDGIKARMDEAFGPCK